MNKNKNYDRVSLIYEPNLPKKKMKNYFLILIFIVFITIITIINYANSFNYYSCNVSKFDLLELNYHWPPALCTENLCNKNISIYHKWQIHGLWPNFNNSTWPQYCCDNYKFDESIIKPLENDLDGKWSKSILKNKNSLWEHEWLKHGTCSLSSKKLKNLFNYFNSTLNLYDKYALQNWLESENILFNSNKTYKLTDVLDAIKNHFNKRVKLECISYEKEYNIKIKPINHSLLSSISICFDENLEPIDCPYSKIQENCRDYIFYLGDSNLNNL